ncbi:MAG TPA: MlaD family protein [Azospirillum sp.]|nr:MlaD family protein [Azospirillum sp.]
MMADRQTAIQSGIYSGFRQSRRRVGLLVLVAGALFVAAVLQAGMLERLLNPSVTLRVILPADGLAGLARGSSVQVLGTGAGQVEEIVIDPNASFHAVVRIERAMQAFIRSDSRVLIRKQFGIAGAAYLDISRGSGAPLDWDYAVLEAKTERAATDDLGKMAQDLSARIIPILEKTDRAVTALAAIAERLERGEGAIGRVLADDTVVRELEETVRTLPSSIDQVGAALASADRLLRELEETVRMVSPSIGRADAMLVSADRLLQNLNRLTPQLRELAGRAGSATAELPTLIAQSQATAAELEKLLVTLQGNWLVGGGGSKAERRPLSPLEVRP